MDKKHIAKLKKALEERQGLITKQLENIAQKNPDVQDDWKAIYKKDGTSSSMDEQAQSVTAWEKARALEHSLELKLRDIKKSLDMIEQGKYGLCKACGVEISQQRLEAVPATIHCRNCMNDEVFHNV